MNAQSAPVRARLELVGLLLAFVALVAAGYLGFRAFAATPDLDDFNLHLLAVVAGIAGFFSPCAFPLLPSYFAFYHRSGGERSGARLALAAAAGVVTFDLVLGALIAVLGAGVAQGLSITSPEPSVLVRAFRGLVGVALLVLGVGQLRGWTLKPRFVDVLAYRTRPRREGTRSAAASLYLYGLGYNAAGMGCTGPILAGLLVFALAAGGAGAALSAFAVFALTMGALMLAVSALVAASRETLITRLKAAAPPLKAAGGVLLVLVGIFNVATTLNQALFVQLLFP